MLKIQVMAEKSLGGHEYARLPRQMSMKLIYGPCIESTQWKRTNSIVLCGPTLAIQPQKSNFPRRKVPYFLLIWSISVALKWSWSIGNLIEYLGNPCQNGLDRILAGGFLLPTWSISCMMSKTNSSPLSSCKKPFEGPRRLPHVQKLGPKCNFRISICPTFGPFFALTSQIFILPPFLFLEVIPIFSRPHVALS